MKLDEKDMKILRCLTVDARVSARKVAQMVGVSTVTVLSKIKKMEHAGIIIRYTAIIDHEKIGYALTAVIEVVIKKEGFDDAVNKIAACINVCGVYDVTGSTDVMIIAKFKTGGELTDFIKELERIHSVDTIITHVVLNMIKEDFRLI